MRAIPFADGMSAQSMTMEHSSGEQHAVFTFKNKSHRGQPVSAKVFTDGKVLHFFPERSGLHRAVLRELGAG